MKKPVSILLIFLILSAISVGCGNQAGAQTSQTAAIGNPWSDWDSIAEAEAAVGFSYGLPEVIADSYTAAAFRTLNSELIEVIYRDGDSEIRVRKQKGEGLDISGDYNQYDSSAEERIGDGTVIQYRNSGSNAIKQLVSHQGFSWSLVTDGGYPGDPDRELIRELWEQYLP